jgi:hypothetical protein
MMGTEAGFKVTPAEIAGKPGAGIILPLGSV